MSALGQKQTFAPQKVMSALPPKADIGTVYGHAHKVSVEGFCKSRSHSCSGPRTEWLDVTKR
jgi:hypothetical protein